MFLIFSLGRNLEIQLWFFEAPFRTLSQWYTYFYLEINLPVRKPEFRVLYYNRRICVSFLLKYSAHKIYSSYMKNIVECGEFSFISQNKNRKDIWCPHLYWSLLPIPQYNTPVYLKTPTQPSAQLKCQSYFHYIFSFISIDFYSVFQ